MSRSVVFMGAFAVAASAACYLACAELLRKKKARSNDRVQDSGAQQVSTALQAASPLVIDTLRKALGDESVTSLELKGQPLESVPPGVFQIKHLTCLDLRGCGLVVLPSEISALQRLEVRERGPLTIKAYVYVTLLQH